MTDRRAVRRGHHRGEQPLALPTPEDPAVAGVARSVAGVESHLAWAQNPDGPDGEQITSRSLEIVERYGWTALHARTWPGLPDVADVHVAIGPGGVVVVAERTWTGRVVVEGDILRHDGFRCERDVEALHAAMAAVVSLLPPEHQNCVSGVIHVTPRDLPAGRIGPVTVLGRTHLASHLVDLPQRLSPLDVADIARAMARAVDVPVTPRTASGAAAASNGTVFYPSTTSAADSASYFVPRQATGPGAPVTAHVPVPAPPIPAYDDATWALLYPTSNRFGIR